MQCQSDARVCLDEIQQWQVALAISLLENALEVANRLMVMQHEDEPYRRSHGGLAFGRRSCSGIVSVVPLRPRAKRFGMNEPLLGTENGSTAADGADRDDSHASRNSRAISLADRVVTWQPVANSNPANDVSRGRISRCQCQGVDPDPPG